jgi:predicted butyrate kinase (DUF1464 family)
MIRVAGADPGTSSLDLLILHDGVVQDQRRFAPNDLQADPAAPVRWLEERGPLDLTAGPSGYGLPLVRASQCGERELALMALTRPDERGRAKGVPGFAAVVRALCASSLPVVFLPGVIHLPTVPAHRKVNRIDLGTPDKLCVAALALKGVGDRADVTDLCVIELGTAFTACLVLDGGRVVDGAGGTSGPFGWGGGGAWDGEAAYLLSPLAKHDLFSGGVCSLTDEPAARACFRESLLRTVAGLQAVTPFEHLVLSGRLLEVEPAFATTVTADLEHLGTVTLLESLPGAWVKHAAQGAALVADGLAGGRHAPLVEHLSLRRASGTVLDWLRYPRADEVRGWFPSSNG